MESAIGYAKERKAFGKVIADFGLIREKLANMAVGIFTGESMAYRTVGMMDAAIAGLGAVAHHRYGRGPQDDRRVRDRMFHS